MCRCGHHEFLHELFRPRGQTSYYRRRCHTGTPAGRCPCQRYERSPDAPHPDADGRG